MGCSGMLFWKPCTIGVHLVVCLLYDVLVAVAHFARSITFMLMSNIINLVNAVWENCWHWLEGPPEATWLCFCWGNIYLNVLDNTIIFSLKDDLGVDWLFESQTANIRYFANHVVWRSSWCWRCNCWAWWIQFWWTPPKSKLSSALISYIPTPVLINLSI